MEKEEALRRTDHYRCRLCGQISPITANLCVKPTCRAQLSIYGDLVTMEEQQETPKPAEPTERTAPQPEIQKETVKPEPPRPKQKKNHGGAGWKTATVLLGILVVIMAISLTIFNETVEESRMASRYSTMNYNDLKDDFDQLKRDYDQLQGDYSQIRQRNQEYQDFWERNNLTYLYSVKVTGVYNGDSDGKKIDNKLNVDTMERLAIAIDITAGKSSNHWAEPLTVKLTRSGEEIVEWSIAPGEEYDDSTDDVSWRMWTGEVKEAGTYVAEFYHMNFMVERYEITVK